MAADPAGPADWDGQGEEKSKSQRKREHHDVKALGERLLTLAPRVLAQLELDDDVLDAIATARKLKHGALQRQLRHLANLLVDAANPEEIRLELDRLEKPTQDAIRALHRLERWRDALIAGDGAVFDEIAGVAPAFERSLVQRLAQAARQERDAGRPPTSARRLHAYLRDLTASPADST